MTAAARALLASMAFLTRIPVGRLVELEGRDVARGALLFPLVGAAVGAATGLVAQLLVPTVPALLGGTLAVVFAVLVTGAMHHDALADTADALGGTTRGRALEIMRDHAVGTYGALALILVCLVDASALGSLAGENDAVLAGAIAGAVGRAAILPLAGTLPYARSETGQGAALENVGWLSVVVATAIAVALSAVGGSAGAVALGAAVVVAAVLLLFYRAWLGGVTGDTLGATAKLCETAAFVAFLAVA